MPQGMGQGQQEPGSLLAALVSRPRRRRGAVTCAVPGLPALETPTSGTQMCPLGLGEWLQWGALRAAGSSVDSAQLHGCTAPDAAGNHRVAAPRRRAVDAMVAGEHAR